MSFRNGWLTIGTWHGATVRLHWSIPLGALFFNSFRLGLGDLCGFILLVLLHELGHAVLVRRYRLRVLSIDVHGLGGVCRWSGLPNAWERAAIAWGGVGAQALLLLAAYLYLLVMGPPHDRFGAELLHAFTRTNLWLIGLNLLPVAPLDGHEAWKLPGMLWRRFQRRRAERARRRSHLRVVKTREAAAEELERMAKQDHGDVAPDVEREIRDALDRATRNANERVRDEPGPDGT